MSLQYKNIRYTKITFYLKMINATETVSEKASAFRGGIGEMLLRSQCISDRKCEKCGFESECIVQRTMYSKFEQKPDFMQKGDSVGYIIHCSDRGRRYEAGDIITVDLTLFGKTIVYFAQYMNAMFALGQCGLGTNNSKFEVVAVKNMFGKDILHGCNVLMENYQWQTIGEYVDYKKRKLGMPDEVVIHFLTPLTLKYQGQIINEFEEEAVKRGILRRLYILNCFENMDTPEMVTESEFPTITHSFAEKKGSYRYSSRKDQYMELKGIIGDIDITNVSEEWLDILIAGEVLGVGNNTSFGYGKYVLR